MTPPNCNLLERWVDGRKGKLPQRTQLFLDSANVLTICPLPRPLGVERRQFITSILCFLITGLIPTGTGVIGPSGVLTGSTSVGKKHVPSDN